MNILIIGSGGREHCLSWKCLQSGSVKNLYAVPGNPGISAIGKCMDITVKGSTFKEIIAFVKEKEIDFTIVGPEAPLVEGIADAFRAQNLKIFGPDKSAARIEGSKIFTKDLCAKYGIATAQSIKFGRSDYIKAQKFIKNKKEEDFPIVLKADGLAAGKGVIIADNTKSAIGALDSFFIKDIFGNAADSIIIEEYIEGFETSILCLCDGSDIIPMLPAQDYKKIFDEDIGANTGGMGSYCPVPLVDKHLYKKILDSIIYPTYEALQSEKIQYRGILYGGIIVRRGQPYLLEYNCRFGDPETQAILPLLDEDLLELLMETESGKLGNRKIKWKNRKCVCVVCASKGYPESSSSGDIIVGLENYLLNEPGSKALVFHAGTKEAGGRIYTNGGRVLGIVSESKTFTQARKNIYEVIGNISFEGMQYRKDIALRAEEE
ncbi:MAG: phosphoribosylamine--glycine ligase [Actinobacteria bacterium]|nr:phosphoribosylamine--glycine ligase [Actinomycetota bacterium]